MKLHTNLGLLKELAEAIETAKGIPEAFVEKDYWLTTVLLELSLSPYKDLVVFKGGTSLSKAYGIIQRFSEDADLALIVQDLTGNQVKSRMDYISKGATKHLPEVKRPGVTSKGSRFRRTAHAFPAQAIRPAISQMAPEVILEVNAFANPYPFELHSINSMIGEFLLERGRQDIIEQYELHPFMLQVLRPERTLAEKVLALARASYAPEPLAQLREKIRHAYDIYCLLQLPEMQAFVTGDEFFQTLRLVQTDDAKNSEFQGEWANKPLSSAWIYQDDPALWKQLESTYTGAFKGLVYGELPVFTKVRDTFVELSGHLKSFDGGD